MNSLTLTRMVILICAFASVHGYANPQYTEKQKKLTVDRLAHQINSNQQQVDSMDNYNRNVFKVTRSVYGGYKDVNVNVPDFERDESLSEAQRNSIRNHQQRAKLIKELVGGKQ